MFVCLHHIESRERRERLTLKSKKLWRLETPCRLDVRCSDFSSLDFSRLSALIWKLSLHRRKITKDRRVINCGQGKVHLLLSGVHVFFMLQFSNPVLLQAENPFRSGEKLLARKGEIVWPAVRPCLSIPHCMLSTGAYLNLNLAIGLSLCWHFPTWCHPDIFDCQVLSAQPTWPIVRNDGNCSWKHLEGIKLAKSGLCY